MNCDRIIKHFKSKEYLPIWIGISWFIFILILRFTADIGPVDLRTYNSLHELSNQFSNGYIFVTWFLFSILTYLTLLTHYKGIYIEYIFIIFTVFLSKIIGSAYILKSNGFGTSFWCIVIGFLIRNIFTNLKVKMSLELFIKIGIVLFVINLNHIVQIGSKGLVIAWVETSILLGISYIIGIYIFQIEKITTLLITTGLSVCGSSAIITIADVIYNKNTVNSNITQNTIDTNTTPNTITIDTNTTTTNTTTTNTITTNTITTNTNTTLNTDSNTYISLIVSILSIFSIPYIILLPYLCKLFSFSDIISGTWIGGSIDSTGTVIASASLLNQEALNSAIVLKMLQNIFIIPLTLIITAVFHHSLHPKLIIEKFPKFIIGFLFISTIVSVLQNQKLVNDCYTVSEWFTNISLVLIGLDIDIRQFKDLFTKKWKLIGLYVLGQTIDTFTTLGFSFWMFGN